jgi:predicted metalloprotease with PDZ domain
MKSLNYIKKVFVIVFLFLLSSCSTFSIYKNTNPTKKVNKISIDLVDVKNDQVNVAIYTPKVSSSSIKYSFPKVVPGTYSISNFGKFIENFQAFDKNGNALTIVKLDENTYQINTAQKLSKITYLVNDTFDLEDEKANFGDGIFSPGGTNIKVNDNFFINTFAFVGYLEGMKETIYQLEIKHPDNLFGSTSMVDINDSNTIDLFEATRYAELIDNPIMYAAPNYSKFNAEGMEILISVYSPSGKIKADKISVDAEKFVTAQKKFLGDFNSNKKYTILLYLASQEAKEAKGFGALEHMSSTTVVLPENMGVEALNEQLKDIVSHEFFHIVTPLNIHSKEIHDFDYNNPKMSEHLWLYEGVTEYFANLFQVNQGLISEEDFYKRMNDKIVQSKRFDDKLSFTKMSKNVLNDPYKNQYVNVYLKGALIAMCIDIQLRELSDGKKGILDLMKDLAKEYGSNKPFNDDELIKKIAVLTYPEIENFLQKHVVGDTPIPYDLYFDKVGVKPVHTTINIYPFMKSKTESILQPDQSTNEIILGADGILNNFMENLGVKSNDRIVSVNNVEYNLKNAYDLINLSAEWKNDDDIVFKVKREGKEIILNGKVKLPTAETIIYQSTDNFIKLRNSWLKM